MFASELDEIDRATLRLLGEDARNTTPVDIARQLPVSDGAVRNRIERMEETGVIEGYLPNRPCGRRLPPDRRLHL